jgi:glycosyltransferase involved in cell wall biosynthesis
VRVSVIIPLYNKAAYVERALASVAAQTFTDFEVIVVDDGSTDEGPKTVADFSDPRVRLIRQDNMGPGAARNRGLREATGELIAFLDADDEWLPDYLAEGVRLLDENPEAATVTSGYFDFPRGASTEDLWRSRGLADGVARVTAETAPARVVSLLAYMSPCTTVARAEVIRNLDGFFDRDHCVYAEDAHLWLKVLFNHAILVNLNPLAKIHFEASGPAQTRRGVRPVEPFLTKPEEIESQCPAELRQLLSQVLAARALKTACVLGYWGNWREARALVRRFQVWGGWRLPYYASSLVCRTPIGAAIGKLWRLTAPK